jgi:uncharacterized RDD family membrane protein YckC
MIEKRFGALWRRASARFIDGIILGCFYGIISLLLLLIDSELISPWFTIVLFIFPIYSFWLHYRYGQTIGKKVMNIKVIHISESQLGFWQALIREMLIFIVLSFTQIYKILNNSHLTRSDLIIVSSLILLLILIDLSPFVLNKKSRTLHDLITKTVVV